VAQELAAKYGKSVAQLALRWSLQKGFLPLPKSVTPQNIEANLQIFDFELSKDDVIQLDKLDGIKSQKNPDEVDF
jgi:diketogulonate reductase-like aldo/keto reductase